MQDWKIKQELYHRLNQIHSDDLNDKEVIISDDIVGYAVRYFKETGLGWIYPAKSYMVGICYARWLSELYGGHPLDYLEDPELLYNNDPYFVQYSSDPASYHQILNSIGSWQFDENVGFVPDVKEYFKAEFMINA
jgi:hypothetical protein